MFEIDLGNNRILPLKLRTFAALNIKERDNLQEWLANQPNALGEELLIIQKEFDGFDDTRERLDLLALDKSGQLVVIENKLDDTGRDVVWQAQKYAAYCSGLTKTQIIDIYQAHLDRYDSGANAAERLKEFLEAEDLDELVLNEGSAQRIIMIAARFRKEVTSTVLWLLSHGLQIQCFKTTLFEADERLFLELKQIIPTPEAADFMIGISSKESEERSANRTTKKRQQLRKEFWNQVLEVFKDKGIDLYQNISPSRDHWLSAGSGVRSCPFTMVFMKNGARVELSLNRSSKKENKWLFDWMRDHQEEVENSFGQTLEWKRLDDKQGSRIAFEQEFNGFEKSEWPEMIDWFVDHLPRLERTFKPLLTQAQQAMPHLEDAEIEDEDEGHDDV